MIDETTKSSLASTVFKSPDFEAVWAECLGIYKNLGFGDYNDDDMIAEFTYVAQQLRKYVFTKQDVILNHDSYEDMLAEVDTLIGKAPEYGSCRKEVAYNFLRDHWLYAIRNFFVALINADDYEEDDDA